MATIITLCALATLVSCPSKFLHTFAQFPKFRVLRNSDNTLTFEDISTGNWFLHTSPLVSLRDTDDGVFVANTKNSMYSFKSLVSTNLNIIATISNNVEYLMSLRTWGGRTTEAFYDYEHTAEMHGTRAVLNGVNTSKNYRIGVPVIKKEGEFAFVEDAFCSSKFLGDLNQYKDTLCIVKVNQGAKGLRANKIARFDVDGCKSLMGDYIATFANLANESYNKAYAEREAELAKIEADNREWEAKKAAKENAIKEKFGLISEKVIDHSSNYGGRFIAEYHFSRNLTNEEFGEFIEMKGHPAQAKPCLYPISPETVTIHSYNNGTEWYYKWTGEWDD